MEILNLVLVAVLIALTAFFVATEFALVKVRSTKIDQLVAEGRKGAISAKHVTTHLDEYLSACQLGITITALGLGWLGEPTVETMLHPLFEKFDVDPSVSQILSFVIAFVFITFLHVVVGELAPKTIAIQKAEALTLLFSKPIMWFYKLMFPFIFVLNGSARLLIGLFGFKSASEHEVAHTEEELRLILSDSFKSGEINQSELNYVNKMFEFDNRIAKEIMVPRTEMVTFSSDVSFDEVAYTIQEERYTRYPIYEGDIDNIIGFINSKDLLYFTLGDRSALESFSIKDLLHPIPVVIETLPIDEVLKRMQNERSQLSLVIDEYGGTAGMVTIEDILEEIVGDIHDEFDADEIAEITRIAEDHYIVSGKVLIEEINDLLGTSLENETVDMIGGWCLSQNYELEEDEVIEKDGFLFIIKELDGHQIRYIEIRKNE
ncbi:hemolysin family protein [Sporosarcina sp. FSL K6-1540]|uniref:hemolysin family protein n=1 Tax=unclassified Sporosarcina TaxID=2647733 RepID=UPI0030F94DDB